LNRRRQPFQNSRFQCFQQLQRLSWDCQTLENTYKADGSWVNVVGDLSDSFEMAERVGFESASKRNYNNLEASDDTKMPLRHHNIPK